MIKKKKLTKVFPLVMLMLFSLITPLIASAVDVLDEPFLEGEQVEAGYFLSTEESSAEIEKFSLGLFGLPDYAKAVERTFKMYTGLTEFPNDPTKVASLILDRVGFERMLVQAIANDWAAAGIYFVPTTGNNIIVSSALNAGIGHMVGFNINIIPYMYVIGVHVVDPFMQRIPNAQVTILDGNRRVQTINMNQFLGMPLTGTQAPMLFTIRPGNYSMEITAPGFAKWRGGTTYWRRIGLYDGTPRSIGGRPPWYGINDRIILRRIGNDTRHQVTGREYFHQFDRQNSNTRAGINHSLRFSLQLFHGRNDRWSPFTPVPGARVSIFDRNNQRIQVLNMDQFPPIENDRYSAFYTSRLGSYYLEISAPGYRLRGNWSGSVYTPGPEVVRVYLGTLGEVTLTNQGLTLGGPGAHIMVSREFVPIPPNEGGARPPQQQTTVPLFRMFHEGLGQHLWTTDEHEYQVLATVGWTQEGIAWHTPRTGRPVHRLFHPGIVRHHYTADQNEIRILRERGWNDEGPLFYCASPDVGANEGIRMTRLYHEGALKHLHTADANEIQVLTTQHGWTYEGESFVGLPAR